MCKIILCFSASEITTIWRYGNQLLLLLLLHLSLLIYFDYSMHYAIKLGDGLQVQ